MKTNKILLIIFIHFFGICISCKKIVEVDTPNYTLVPQSVFKNNDLATSALLGIYQQMSLSGYASGGETSIAAICGLTADELIGYNTSLKPIYDNQITQENTVISDIWTKLYQRIYDANAILEGLETSNTITPVVYDQLKGEALFIRSFNYFYLINLFGDSPLYLTTDYKSNSVASRKLSTDIYAQIIGDLITAESLLGTSYVTTERVRPNKDTVRALLSRVYLYTKDWINAEKYASLIIANEGSYKLTALNDTFLSNSLETIWQLMPTANTNTLAGSMFILTNTPTVISLRKDFAEQAFEANDQRKIAWVKSIVSNSVTYYYPFKYKIKSSTTVTEYNMVFRLAEQFLIRAEARAKHGNLNGAIDDLDKIRFRAGLPLLKNINPGIDQQNLINAIQKERKVEFFSEWGDRWLDLKRVGNSSSILSPIKTNWKVENLLYPIPKVEIDRNRNITQNKGYQ